MCHIQRVKQGQNKEQLEKSRERGSLVSRRRMRNWVRGKELGGLRAQFSVGDSLDSRDPFPWCLAYAWKVIMGTLKTWTLLFLTLSVNPC